MAACLGDALYVVPPVRAQARSQFAPGESSRARERDLSSTAAFYKECGIGNVMVPTKSCSAILIPDSVHLCFSYVVAHGMWSPGARPGSVVCFTKPGLLGRIWSDAGVQSLAIIV